MRDGTKLFTVVYAPKDTAKTYPMLLLRTPYGVGPYGPDTYPQVPGVRNDCGSLGRLRKLRDAYCVVLDTGNTSGSWPLDSSDHRQRFTARAQVTYSPDTEKVGQQIKGGFTVENERYFRELSRGIEARIDEEHPQIEAPSLSPEPAATTITATRGTGVMVTPTRYRRRAP